MASAVSAGTGGSAVLFGALGAEPVAAGLAGVSLVADGVGALAGAYVAYSEGDYGPLKSSAIGSIASTVTGIGWKGFGSTISHPFAGVTVTTAASETKAAAASYVAGQVAGNAPAQTCSQSAF